MQMNMGDSSSSSNTLQIASGVLSQIDAALTNITLEHTLK
jgi:hypothetical protein